MMYLIKLISVFSWYIFQIAIQILYYFLALNYLSIGNSTIKMFFKNFIRLCRSLFKFNHWWIVYVGICSAVVSALGQRSEDMWFESKHRPILFGDFTPWSNIPNWLYASITNDVLNKINFKILYRKFWYLVDIYFRSTFKNCMTPLVNNHLSIQNHLNYIVK